MNISTCSGPNSARLCLAAVWGALWSLMLLAPILAKLSFPLLSASIYIFFSGFCHQAPERSFWLAAHPLAACHRCAGIYTGLFLGSLIAIRFSVPTAARRRKLLIAAIGFLSLDALLPFVGLWSSSPFSRFTTGLAFGLLGSSILSHGVAELEREFSWRRVLSALGVSREAAHE